MDRTTVGRNSDIEALNLDSNDQNQETTDHRASPAVSSQDRRSNVPTSPIPSISPLLTLQVHNLTLPSNEPVINTSADAFLPALGLNSAEPPLKKAKTQNGTDVSYRSDWDDECSICLDRWTDSGEHRLVALKCGHVFGHSCVTKWLESKPDEDRKCPICKADAQLLDVRFLYAQRLVAVDTSENNELKRKLDTTMDEKNRMEFELRQALLKTKSKNEESYCNVI